MYRSPSCTSGVYCIFAQTVIDVEGVNLKTPSTRTTPSGSPSISSTYHCLRWIQGRTEGTAHSPSLKAAGQGKARLVAYTFVEYVALDLDNGRIGMVANPQTVREVAGLSSLGSKADQGLAS